MLNTLPVFFFSPKPGFRFFSNAIPACFSGFLSAFQWLAPGQQMVQMAYYIFPGLMKRTVRNLAALAWCLMADNAAQKWQRLEIILIKMIWSLLSFKCCFYPSFLHLYNFGFLSWKHIVSKLDTTVSETLDIIHFSGSALLVGQRHFIAYHVLLYIRLVWS